jgi:hypothetical protein
MCCFYIQSIGHPKTSTDCQKTVGLWAQQDTVTRFLNRNSKKVGWRQRGHRPHPYLLSHLLSSPSSLKMFLEFSYLDLISDDFAFDKGRGGGGGGGRGRGGGGGRGRLGADVSIIQA